MISSEENTLLDFLYLNDVCRDFADLFFLSFLTRQRPLITTRIVVVFISMYYYFIIIIIIIIIIIFISFLIIIIVFSSIIIIMFLLFTGVEVRAGKTLPSRPYLKPRA